MFSTPFFELKMMIVSVFLLSLEEKKLQPYVFYTISRAEGDGRVGFLFLFRKKALALCFRLYFSS